MKNPRIIFASVIAITLLTAGCNSSTLSGGNSGEKMTIQKRAILSGRADSNVRFCAEPSPDAMSAMAMQGAAQVSDPAKVSAELSAVLQQSAAFVGLRTTSIQLLRDFGYRLCEAYLSGAINKGQYDLLMRRFQKNVVALLAIEQLTGAIKAPPVVLTSQGKAQISQSLLDQQNARQQVTDKIASLEKEKEAKISQKKVLQAANANADTKDLDSQIAAKEDEIKRRQTDLEAIDKGIANARGSLVQGKTEATIGSDSSQAQRTTQDIQTVAEVVKHITNEIVRGKDTMEECLLVLQSTEDYKTSTDPQRTIKDEFATSCLEIVKLPYEISRHTMAISQVQIEEAKKVLSDKSSTSDQKASARTTISEIQGKLEELRKEMRPNKSSETKP